MIDITERLCQGADGDCETRAAATELIKHLRLLADNQCREIERLQAYVEEWKIRYETARLAHEEGRAEIERLQAALDLSADYGDEQVAALRKIDEWSRAYPLSAFPEPDLVKAHALLKAGGMTLDAISASAMRHVVEGVGKIAREALEFEK